MRRIGWVTLDAMVLTTVLAVVVCGVAAAEPPDTAQGRPEAKGPLADRPSKPGAHIEKVKALGDNAWLNLGKPAPDPKYGPAQGRSWSRKMAFAPDLRGAFLYGEGPHGASSVRGGARYYNDDLHFYDINAHAWVCCHPGTPLDDPGLTYDKELGCERDRNGNIIPVAVSVHAYWTPDYDTDRKMFMFTPSPASMYWEPALKKHRPYLYEEGVADPRWSKEHSPYYYDGRTGRFDRRKAKRPFRPPANVDNALFYSPRQKKAVYFLRGVWLYDYEANAWAKASDEGGGNAAYCYDSRRDQVYVVTGQSKRDEMHNWAPVPGSNRLRIYDIPASRWSSPPHEGDAGGGMESNQAFFTYDSANDVAVLHIHGEHHIYDPNAKKWTVLPVTLSEKVDWIAGSGFYDPETNAHFYFSAQDGSIEPGNMWAWRYAWGGRQ